MDADLRANVHDYSDRGFLDTALAANFPTKTAIHPQMTAPGGPASYAATFAKR